MFVGYVMLVPIIIWFSFSQHGMTENDFRKGSEQVRGLKVRCRKTRDYLFDADACSDCLCRRVPRK